MDSLLLIALATVTALLFLLFELIFIYPAVRLNPRILSINDLHSIRITWEQGSNFEPWNPRAIRTLFISVPLSRTLFRAIYSYLCLEKRKGNNYHAHLT